MARVIGLDIGERRIGVAISDPERRLAVPLRIIERRNDDADLQTIVQLAREERADTFVVGNPLTLAGEAGQQAKLARAFADRLAKRSGLRVELCDERLSSVQAERLGDTKHRRLKKQRRPTDDIAASLVLQTYLDRARRSASPSEDA